MTATTTAPATVTAEIVAAFIRRIGEEAIQEAATATDRLKDELDGRGYGQMADAMGRALSARHAATPWLVILDGNSTDEGIVAAAQAMYQKALVHLTTSTIDITKMGALQGMERAAIADSYRSFVAQMRPILDQLATD